jgi:hypothetical protein
MKKKLRIRWHETCVSVSVIWLCGLLMPAFAHGHDRSLDDAGTPTIKEAIDFTISGKVRDESGQPVPGANILLKGTTIGTTTDSEGAYTFAIPEERGTLIFSFIGFATHNPNAISPVQ